MAGWTKVLREDGQSPDGKSLVSLRKSAIAFNAHFIRANSLADFLRATVFVDADRRKVGFKFHSNVSDRDSFALTTDGGSKGEARIIQVQALMVKNRWLRAASKVTISRARQYSPTKAPDGIWTIWIRPSFEVAVRLEDKDKIPSDVAGIYRYLDREEVVYVGCGLIRSRLATPERSGWVFDRIEYSPVEDQSEQARWEGEWLEEHRNKVGFLPRYKRVGGVRQK